MIDLSPLGLLWLRFGKVSSNKGSQYRYLYIREYNQMIISKGVLYKNRHMRQGHRKGDDF